MKCFVPILLLSGALPTSDRHSQDEESNIGAYLAYSWCDSRTLVRTGPMAMATTMSSGAIQ